MDLGGHDDFQWARAHGVQRQHLLDSGAAGQDRRKLLQPLGRQRVADQQIGNRTCEAAVGDRQQDSDQQRGQRVGGCCSRPVA